MGKKAFDIKNLGGQRTGSVWPPGEKRPLKQRRGACLRPANAAFRRVPLSLENRQPNQCATRNFDARWTFVSNLAEIGGD